MAALDVGELLHHKLAAETAAQAEADRSASLANQLAKVCLCVFWGVCPSGCVLRCLFACLFLCEVSAGHIQVGLELFRLLWLSKRLYNSPSPEQVQSNHAVQQKYAKPTVSA